MTGQAGARARLLLRGCVFTALATWIVLAPGLAEYGRGLVPRWVPRWDMFAEAGLNVIELKLETLDDQGRRVPVNRFEVLGYEGRWDAPDSVRLVQELRDVKKLTDKLCRNMNGRPLFVRVRSATRDGFKLRDKGKRDVCADSEQRHTGKRR